MIESDLGPVYSWKELVPVILVVVYKGAKALEEVLVYDFSLTVSLLIERYREFDFSADNTIELVPKRRDKLRPTVRHYRQWRVAVTVDVIVV